MKKNAIILSMVAMIPLSAQNWEVGAFVGQQKYKDASAAYAGTGNIAVSSENKTIYGFRVGRSLFDFGPVLLSATAGYQPKVTSTLTSTYTMPLLSYPGTPAAGVPVSAASQATGTTTGQLGSSSYAVGAMFNFRAFVAIGAGVEYRVESLDSGGTSTNYARPWVRANAGVSIPSPLLKPFIGVEVDYPLGSKSYDPNGSPEDKLKAVASKGQIGIYGGIRF